VVQIVIIVLTQIIVTFAKEGGTFYLTGLVLSVLLDVLTAVMNGLV